MPNYSRATIIGHACADPETRDANGKTVANFTVAVNDPFGPKGNDGKPIAVFYRVAAWDRRLVDVATKYVKKGDAVMVEGRLSVESYRTREGQERAALKVNASDIVRLSSRRDEAPQEAPKEDGRQARAAAPSAMDDQPDDLPF